MNDIKKNDVDNKDDKKVGLDVSDITFDKNGEIIGLSDDVLDSITGGLSVTNSCGGNMQC
ncbi:hypothetical protein [Solimicrobium silvestre]|uniref:Uncharacterized protein n=1 Tax=Solimicrobium silvestre TaxID=2099400 RepID=A0A2S9GYJ5_9BURK|nr:hypothetical protein [Solimicrobium silvestre]PRC92797.1 hypothetical protein S2091_2527 [Solimicrobium silvestre]